MNLLFLVSMGGPELFLILLFTAVPFTFFVIALIDVIRNEFTGNNKIVWLLVVILMPLGWLVYFIFGRKQKINRNAV